MPVRRSFSRSAWKTTKPDYVNDHKKKFPDVVKDLIKSSDLLLEVLDARSIDATRNQELEKLIKDAGKKVVKIINKIDLVDLKDIKKNVELSKFEPYVLYSAKKKSLKRRLQDRIKIEVKKLKLPYPVVRVGIIGYPNVGKSTIINSLTGGGKVSTSSEAGHTKAIAKIRFTKNIVILDAPGVIPIGEDSNTNLASLKKHVGINVRTYDKVKNPDFIVMDFMDKNPGKLQKYYDIDSDDVEEFLEILGKRLKYLKKGGMIDTDRVARVVLKAIQEGKLN